MEYSYETLLEENTELRKALTRSKEMVERFRSDNDSIKQVHDDFKYHYDKLKKDCNLYQARCTEAEQTKKEIEQNYDSMVRRFKTQIETKQKDLDELSERVAPPIDNEMLRLRLVSEVEAPYKVALEQKQAEIGSLEHACSDMQKKLILLQEEYTSIREESEREIRDLKERNQFDTMQYNKEIMSLQNRLEDPTDKETIRRLQRENEEKKSKVQSLGQEIDNVRKAREVLAAEKNNIFISSNKEIEEERSVRRTITHEKDRLEVQYKDATETLSRIRGDYDIKLQEITALKNEIESLKSNLRVSEEQIGNYKTEMGNIREELIKRETEIESKVREIIETEHEKIVKERQEKSSLQKEIDRLQRQIHDTELSGTSSEKFFKAEIEHLKQENAIAGEEQVALRSRNTQIDAELTELKNSCSTKLSDYDRVEQEYKELQTAHRQILDQQTKLGANKDDLDTSLKAANDTLGFYKQQVSKAEDGTEKLRDEIAEYKNKIEGMQKNTDIEVNRQRKKTREYKNKVRFANDKIKELGEKLLALDRERNRVVSSKEDMESRIYEAERERDEYKMKAFSAHSAEAYGTPLIEESQRIQAEIDRVAQSTNAALRSSYSP